VYDSQRRPPRRLTAFSADERRIRQRRLEPLEPFRHLGFTGAGVGELACELDDELIPAATVEHERCLPPAERP
jgi:hypothetical protein